MTMTVVPTSDQYACYSQITEIGGRAYLLRFDWNGRRGLWTLAIYDAESEDRLLVGRTLVDGWPVNMRSVDARMPDRWLMCFDLSGSGLPPGFSDLGPGGRSQLYVTPPGADAGADARSFPPAEEWTPA